MSWATDSFSDTQRWVEPEPDADALDIGASVQLTASTFSHAKSGLTLLGWTRFPAVTGLDGTSQSTVLEFRGSSALARFQFQESSTNLQIRTAYTRQTGGGRSWTVLANANGTLSVETWYLMALVLAADDYGRFYIYDTAGTQVREAHDTTGGNVSAVPTTFDTAQKLGYESGTPGIPFDIGQVALIGRALTTAELASWSVNGILFDDADFIGGYKFSNLTGEGSCPDFSGSPTQYLRDAGYPVDSEYEDTVRWASDF